MTINVKTATKQKKIEAWAHIDLGQGVEFHPLGTISWPSCCVLSWDDGEIRASVVESQLVNGVTSAQALEILKVLRKKLGTSFVQVGAAVDKAIEEWQKELK